jgi:para-aminobenzoate synthetase component 1
VDLAPAVLAARLRGERGLVWLDGGRGRHRLYHRPLALLRSRDGRSVVSTEFGETVLECGGLDLLEAALEAWGPLPGAELAGMLGYELGHELEDLPPPPPDDLGLPDLQLGLYDGVFLGEEGLWRLHGTDAWRGESGLPWTAAETSARLTAEGPGPGERARARLSRGPLVSHPTGPGFTGAVARTVERIHQGEVFQVNLCRRLEAPLDEEAAWPLYLRLREESPAEYGAYLQLEGGGALLSVSPERFLRVREGRVETRPIKGTRPRGATPEADRALARELESSEKDRSELSMIVDLMRNDLGRVCEAGSVEVVEHAVRVGLPTVHHTHSTVAGRLRDPADLAGLLRACFPAGSITGAPKIQAMVIAGAEEERRRGPAMGSLGWIGLDGDLDLSVAIRTAAVSGGRVAYHAGGGIVADSDPVAELRETSAKARAFLRALGLEEEGP